MEPVQALQGPPKTKKVKTTVTVNGQAHVIPAGRKPTRGSISTPSHTWVTGVDISRSARPWAAIDSFTRRV